MSNKCCHIDVFPNCVLHCWEPCNGKYCWDPCNEKYYWDPCKYCHKHEIMIEDEILKKCCFYGCSFLCENSYCIRHDTPSKREALINKYKTKEYKYNEAHGLCLFNRNNKFCSNPSNGYKFCRSCGISLGICF